MFVLYSNARNLSLCDSLSFLMNFQSTLDIFNWSSYKILPIPCVLLSEKQGSAGCVCAVCLSSGCRHTGEKPFTMHLPGNISSADVVFPSWLLSSRPKMTLWIQRINPVSSHYKHFKWLPPTEHMDWSHIFSSVCCSRAAIPHNYKKLKDLTTVEKGPHLSSKHNLNQSHIPNSSYYLICSVPGVIEGILKGMQSFTILWDTINVWALNRGISGESVKRAFPLCNLVCLKWKVLWKVIFPVVFQEPGKPWLSVMMLGIGFLLC